MRLIHENNIIKEIAILNKKYRNQFMENFNLL